MSHEEQVIRAFVKPSRQPRYLQLLSNKKGREKLARKLAHSLEVDERYAFQIPANEQKPSRIAELLKAKGAPQKCYIISENSELDGKELPLSEAIERAVGYGMGTILSCKPGELAYYEAEDAGVRYILEKRAV